MCGVLCYCCCCIVCVCDPTWLKVHDWIDDDDDESELGLLRCKCLVIWAGVEIQWDSLWDVVGIIEVWMSLLTLERGKEEEANPKVEQGNQWARIRVAATKTPPLPAQTFTLPAPRGKGIHVARTNCQSKASIYFQRKLVSRIYTQPSHQTRLQFQINSTNRHITKQITLT